MAGLGEQLSGAGVIGQAQLVVAGLDDRGKLAVEVPAVAGQRIGCGAGDLGGCGGDERAQRWGGDRTGPSGSRHHVQY
jgi:hypothetical protein